MKPERAVGTMTSFRAEGYGWLSWNGTCVWIHIRDTRDNGKIPAALKQGWRIEFDVTETPRGLRAMNAVVVDKVVPKEALPCPQTA